MTEVLGLEGLCYRYPGGQQALGGVSFTVAEGESVAIVGPNGAGKSTLLLHLNGLLRPTSGRVRLLGRVIDDNNLKWARQQVGLVFQNPDDQLFCPSIFDDVAFGPLAMGYPDDEVRRRVSSALDSVGLAGFEQRSPLHLSLGEKKRAALATVLSMSPELLALDEPSANLDPGGKWALASLLRELSLTKIIVSHDLELVRALCPRVIIMDSGQVIADGSAAEILADEALLAAHKLAPGLAAALQ